MLNLILKLLSILILLSALLTVLSTHILMSLVFFITTIILSSALLFLFDCEFLALLFILIYVGAIAVLFLFAVMMVETKSVNLYKSHVKYFPFAFMICSFLILSLMFNIVADGVEYPVPNSYFDLKLFDWYKEIDSPSELNVFADVLYSYYVVQFLFVGFILLFALMAVVFLTRIPKLLKEAEEKKRQNDKEAYKKNYKG